MSSLNVLNRVLAEDPGLTIWMRYLNCYSGLAFYVHRLDFLVLLIATDLYSPVIRVYAHVQN